MPATAEFARQWNASVANILLALQEVFSATFLGTPPVNISGNPNPFAEMFDSAELKTYYETLYTPSAAINQLFVDVTSATPSVANTAALEITRNVLTANKDKLYRYEYNRLLTAINAIDPADGVNPGFRP